LMTEVKTAERSAFSALCNLVVAGVALAPVSLPDVVTLLRIIPRFVLVFVRDSAVRFADCTTLPTSSKEP
jgi:hypothetical protein